jgi:hypothetical protein
MNAYFQDELNSGKMTFGIYNIGDSKNTTVVKKYSPITSSLYVNTIKDDTDSIRNIEQIWSWNCRSDKKGFDRKVRNIIYQSLQSEE